MKQASVSSTVHGGGKRRGSGLSIIGKREAAGLLPGVFLAR
jgi:hypothetical protein